MDHGFSLVTGDGGIRARDIAAEDESDAVVENDTPVPGNLVRLRQRELRRDDDGVDRILVERLLPAMLDIHDVEVAFPEVVSVEIAAPVDKHLLVRIQVVDQVIAPLVFGEDVVGFRSAQLSQRFLGIKLRIVSRCEERQRVAPGNPLRRRRRKQDERQPADKEWR